MWINLLIDSLDLSLAEFDDEPLDFLFFLLQTGLDVSHFLFMMNKIQ